MPIVRRGAPILLRRGMGQTINPTTGQPIKLPPGETSLSPVMTNVLSNPVIEGLIQNGQYISAVGQPGGPVTPGTVVYNPDTNQIITPSGAQVNAQAYLATLPSAGQAPATSGSIPSQSNAPSPTPVSSGSPQAQSNAPSPTAVAPTPSILQQIQNAITGGGATASGTAPVASQNWIDGIPNLAVIGIGGLAVLFLLWPKGRS
jgi:hypothetical protein